MVTINNQGIFVSLGDCCLNRKGWTRNRPEIRLNPVPAGFSAPKSGSGSGPVSSRFAGFQPEFKKIF